MSPGEESGRDEHERGSCLDRASPEVLCRLHEPHEEPAFLRRF